MKNNTELRKLMAPKGTILTDGETYGTEIYLGVNDSPFNWYEISEEEYKEKLKEETSLNY